MQTGWITKEAACAALLMLVFASPVTATKENLEATFEQFLLQVFGLDTLQMARLRGLFSRALGELVKDQLLTLRENGVYTVDSEQY
jgi:hypothetical protein